MRPGGAISLQMRIAGLSATGPGCVKTPNSGSYQFAKGWILPKGRFGHFFLAPFHEFPRKSPGES
jgi:hypothetical protein